MIYLLRLREQGALQLLSGGRADHVITPDAVAGQLQLQLRLPKSRVRSRGERERVRLSFRRGGEREITPPPLLEGRHTAGGRYRGTLPYTLRRKA